MYLILAKNRKNLALQLIHSKFYKWLYILALTADSKMLKCRSKTRSPNTRSQTIHAPRNHAHAVLSRR